jgi:riboflavin synthase
MFTGIITHVGRVEAMTPADGGTRVRVACPDLAGSGLQAGESIAVAGVCLTVTGFDATGFDADVSGETLRLTTLGGLRPGSNVNLERALRAGDRLGGHLVSGHVDGVGTVATITADGLSQRFSFDPPDALRRYFAVKGSVTVDGVSLTINSVDLGGFGVNLIPHTLAHTTLGTLQPGSRVNLEVDQIARYVERLLAARDPS